MKMNNVRIRIYNRRKGTVKPTFGEYAGMQIQFAELYVYYNDGGRRDTRFSAYVCLPSPYKVQFETFIGEVKDNIIRICSKCETHEQIVAALKVSFEYNKFGYIVGVK